MKGFKGRTIIFVAMIVVILFSVACDEATRPPADVEKALTDYWQSLPADPAPTYQITNAWPGDLSARAVESTMPDLEVWCVEAEISAAEDETIVGEKIVWIVTRSDQSAPWQAAMLATMSSTWPYEACLQPL